MTSSPTPDSPARPATGAVFLSYASQDADAAKKICEAFQVAGIEVWLDQSELVGGDAWDQKIRGQIKACALFVPVISAGSQARREGYFRLEWKLAAQRTHTIADGTPFLLPVVIDGTRDAEALVPEEFRSVQWTRLTGGEATAGFVARVKKLLGLEVAPVSDRRTETHQSTDAGQRPALPRRRARLGWVLGIAAIIAIGVFGWIATQRNTISQSATELAARRHAPPTPEKAASPQLDEKSIAVLPFANRSPDPENAFFTDGVHEDILTNLFNIRELRVVSRTSVEQYRGTAKSMKQIGAELGVAYILEGSVQRVGNKVHVTGQLIDARTDAHLWAKSFDKDLSDIFVIQTELAKAIAGELQAVLSPQEKTLIERRPTKNLAAYDLYLKAREITRSGATGIPWSRAEPLLQAAVELDPNFAVAWALLCYVQSMRFFINEDHTSAQRTRAKAAMDNAVRLAPESPEVIRAVGDYYYYGFRDYARALEQYEGLARLQPNYPEAHYFLGAAVQRYGRMVESVAQYRKVVQLDPGYFFAVRNLARALEAGRRYDEAAAVWRQLVSALPGDLNNRFRLARSSYAASGTSRVVEEFLAQLTGTEANSDVGINLRKEWAMSSGNLPECLRLDQAKPNLALPILSGRGGSTTAINAAIVLAAQGNLAGARDRLGDGAELRTQIESDPMNEQFWAGLGKTEALLGHKEEALRCAGKAVELLPESLDAVDGPRIGAALAFVYAWTGEKDLAIAEYARLLRVPFSGLNIYEMRRDPTYTPLRGDPRFEALINDPKNNAPLF